LFIIICRYFPIYISNQSVRTAAISEISLRLIELKDDKLIISGDFVSSASGFKGFDYRIDDKSIIIHINKALTHKELPSNFSFCVHIDNTVVNAVYIVDDYDRLLIWEAVSPL
jgi:hypothetical protein